MDGRVPYLRLQLAVVGLAQGAVYWLLSSPSHSQELRALLVMTAVTAVVFTIEYAWAGRHLGRLLAGAVVLAAPLVLVTWWVARCRRRPGPDTGSPPGRWRIGSCSTS